MLILISIRNFVEDTLYSHGPILFHFDHHWSLLDNLGPHGLSWCPVPGSSLGPYLIWLRDISKR